MKFENVFKGKTIKSLLVICTTAIIGTQSIYAQVNTIADTSKMTYSQFSSMVGLYVYPSKQQTNHQQKNDEFECYKWAVKQSGYDPVHPTTVKADTAQKSNNGAVVKKAALGTAVGSMLGQAGRGAAIGAVSGIKQKKAMDAAQRKETEDAIQQKQQAVINNYKNAFSACMEGKGYTIK